MLKGPDKGGSPMQMTTRRVVIAFLASVVAAPLLAAALGSAPMNVDGLTLELTSVERKGSVLTVKWSVRNDAAKSKYVDIDLAGSKPTTYAVDEENGTKYFALMDKEGQLLASEHEYDGVYESIEPGQTKRFWAKFPAPPPAVKAINLLFTDTEPFESVAITDK
jgi:hypothetical protein